MPAAWKFAIAAALCLAAPAAARQLAQPAASAETIELGQDAIAYIPATLDRSAPAPLIILLHGARGGPAAMLPLFREAAERHGVVLLAPASLGRSWDMILDVRNRLADGSFRGETYQPLMRDDPQRIDAALAALGRRLKLDRKRTALAGFSDGASYALTLGTHRPDRFPVLIAFSPGLAFPPRQARGAQRVFIAHGRADQGLSHRVSAEEIAPMLRAGGLAVTFHSFDGDHSVPPAVQSAAFAFFLGRGVTAGSRGQRPN